MNSSGAIGDNDPAAVQGKFDAVANENDPQRTLDCTDPFNVCDGNVIAYTVIATTNIYFCDIFFDEVPLEQLCTGQTSVSARNVYAGTVLHELTHAVASTDDVTYGCENDQNLDAPNQLVNADSYNCFATQAWQDTQCYNA
uniref:deuterolysin n=1 Tax=Moniliophthora roreri TaxID=221103 RepID=A0A0W0GF83_MONRR